MIAPFTQELGRWGMLPPMRACLLLLPLLCLLPLAAPAQSTLSDRDHERVRAAVARGEMVPLADVLADAQRRHPGTVLEVELEDDEYEVEILGDDGVIRELEYDVRTGALLEVEIEVD
jgi:uncharacterized membrane protein YkoI